MFDWVATLGVGVGVGGLGSRFCRHIMDAATGKV